MGKVGTAARAGAVLMAAVLLTTLVAVFATVAPSSATPGFSLGKSSTFSVRGVSVPGTPAKYDKVTVRRYGPRSATNVLVLVPGTNAGAADFDIVGPYLATHVPNLQVWAEMRREGALQQNTTVKATVQATFNYYLGWLKNSKITNHYQPLQASQYGFVDQWGFAVAMGDLNNVIQRARDNGTRTVILGGHSLGGAEASIYPAWDFNGQAGYQQIGGIIGIDGDAGQAGGIGGTSLTTAAQANTALTNLEAGSPWLDLLGLGLPWVTGAFAEVAAQAAAQQPNAPSILQASGLVPASLAAPVTVTNLGALGYAFDASTSPASLALIHVTSGHLDTSTSPAGWVNTGPTPVQNVADVFSEGRPGAVDWYYPERLSIDTEAADSLTQTPAATVLGLRLEHVAQVNVPMYVIQTSLGGTNNEVIDAAEAYKAESQIPSLTTVNEAASYSHLDPLLAAPSQNQFLQTIVPWIEALPSYKS